MIVRAGGPPHLVCSDLLSKLNLEIREIIFLKDDLEDIFSIEHSQVYTYSSNFKREWKNQAMRKL